MNNFSHVTQTQVSQHMSMFFITFLKIVSIQNQILCGTNFFFRTFKFWETAKVRKEMKETTIELAKETKQTMFVVSEEKTERKGNRVRGGGERK